MPEVIKALILGIIQGLTEFIPVSSSAHLALTPWYLGWQEAYGDLSLFFDLVLHWGTLLAMAVVFWRDYLTLIGGLVPKHRPAFSGRSRCAAGLVHHRRHDPGGVGRLFLQGSIEAFFHPAGAEGNVTARCVGFFMLVTAGLLAGSECWPSASSRSRELPQMNWLDSILIGCCPGLCPGARHQPQRQHHCHWAGPGDHAVIRRRGTVFSWARRRFWGLGCCS